MTESEDGMKELTDEQYAEIGDLIYKTGWPSPMVGVSRGNLRLGKAAVAAVAPILLGEPTPEETHFYGQIDATVLRAAFRDRLAALTAKPDPAVEAVKALTINWLNMKLTDSSAREVVAAVDKARA